MARWLGVTRSAHMPTDRTVEKLDTLDALLGRIERKTAQLIWMLNVALVLTAMLVGKAFVPH